MLRQLVIELTEDNEEYFLHSDEEIIATNRSIWQWEYDQDDRYAYIIRKKGPDMLRMVIAETHIKSGLGAGTRRAILEDVNIGTLSQPNIGVVAGLLKKHSHDRTRAGSPFKREWKARAPYIGSKVSEIIESVRQHKGA